MKTFIFTLLLTLILTGCVTKGKSSECTHTVRGFYCEDCEGE